MASIFSQTDLTSDHPSSSTPRRYDVFLSFRGEDTRDNFAYYLYRSFLEKGIHTFRDDDEIERGKQVMTELMKAINESQFSVIVISQNYASSSWCLNELVRILECTKTLGQTVYAVFYHVDPSNVRKQTGKFGEGFSEAVSKDEMSAQIWKEALVEIAGLKGWVYPSPGYGAEVEFIDALAEDIFGKLKDTYPNPLEGLVGMTYRMDEVIKLLDLGSDEARMVGIWGMGGIGKTTIAKAVYQSISGQFEGCSFIENAREVANRSGLKALQEQLISNTLSKKYFELKSVMSGRSIIRHRVCHKKVLIVLDVDDVDEYEVQELENLIRNLNLLSNGSRVIITTRDRHMLDLLGVKDVYEVQELSIDESKELFICKAFAENREFGEFQRLIDRAIEYAQGIPLALKVLGSFLLNKTLREWESALDRLKESPCLKVQKVLRISYDGLHSEDKEIFLDISCFFRGKDKDWVINFLGACGFNPDIGIRVLVEKSLLTISEKNAVEMHDLVQKMGWTIVHEESRKEPGKRSRLWHHDDIKRVVTENTGTKKIEGICDKISAMGAEDLKLVPNALEKMKNLRLLRIHSTSSCMYLPNMLRYLHWHGYPSKCLPATFQPEHLVELHLTHSRIKQIWDGKMVLQKLIVLDLSDSTCLTKSPEFKSFPNLEKLYLVGCTALRNLHPFVEELEKLVIVNLDGCSSLRSIPQSIGNATNLWYLNLSNCKKLKRIPSSIGQLKKLRELKLKGCISLNELPEVVGLSKLELLGLEGCKKLQELPELPSNLGFLWASGCESLKTICSLSSFKNAWDISFSKCPKLIDNEEIKSLREIKFLFNKIKVNNRVDRSYIFPGSKIPKWFTYRNDGGLLKIKVPRHNSSSLLGFAFAVIVLTKSQACRIGVYIRDGDKIFETYEDFDFSSYSKVVSIMYVPARYLFGEDSYPRGGVDLEVCFGTRDYQSCGSSSIRPAPEVKSCGMHLIYELDLLSFGENDKVGEHLPSFC